jgi:hypothetical protein
MENRSATVDTRIAWFLIISNVAVVGLFFWGGMIDYGLRFWFAADLIPKAILFFACSWVFARFAVYAALLFSQNVRCHPMAVIIGLGGFAIWCIFAPIRQFFFPGGIISLASKVMLLSDGVYMIICFAAW